MNWLIFWFVIIFIIALFAVIGILNYKYNLMRAYYDYQAKKVETLEKKFNSEKDVSDKSIKELQAIAYTNPITNIWNLDYFIVHCEKQQNRHSNASFTLVAFNIINIGKINQLFGPTEGDKVIYYTAQCLNKLIFSTNVYAQIHSNLFCLLLKDTTDEEAVSLTARLSSELRKYDDNIEIKPGFGICHIDDKDKKILDIINDATLALKFVKDTDEISYQFFTTTLNETFLNNKKMSEEMEEALEDHKFFMYLQPMVDLHSYKIISAEALVRWDYPGKGILSPHAFLPLFENTSLIQKLDYYMWEECCKTIRRWIDNKIEPTPITMNISPSHLQNTKFIDHLIQLMDHYLIKRDMMILEIPEHALSASNKAISEIINRLSQEGFILCIDNFGSINSPLNLLKDLPIQRIKLDRSFLSKNSSSDAGITILRYLISMAKELDFTVITEGIETQDQASFLLELGCDIGQGYHFSKPVDLRTFDQLNKTVVNTLYRPNEYYPTFEDFEKDIDFIVQIFRSRSHEIFQSEQ